MSSAADYTPRDLQIPITNTIIEIERCAVFAQPGSGKTVATLSALDTLAYCEPVWPALVISTKRVAQSVWPVEVGLWRETEHLKVSAIIGDPAARTAAATTRAHIHTVNFDNVPWLVKKWGNAWPYKTIIIDESTKLAGFRLTQGTKRTRVIESIAWRGVHRFIELTGTPTMNGLHKLWGPTYFLDRGERLGHSFAAFEDRYFYHGRDGYSLKAFPGALDECASRIADISVAIKLDDYIKLPPVIDVPMPIDLPDKVMSQYREFERELTLSIGDETITSDNAMLRAGKLLQLTSGAVYPDRPDLDHSPNARRLPGDWVHVHDQKLDALEALIEELNDAPLIVAYWWRSDLERLIKRFRRAKRLDDNPETIRKWNAGEYPILLTNPASAGHGLSLQHGGNAIAFFSQWFDAELYQQLIDRLGPMRQFQSGYNRRVFVYHLTARGTIDERVTARTTARQHAQNAFFDRVNSPLA